jgi:hypothetical protein
MSRGFKMLRQDERFEMCEFASGSRGNNDVKGRQDNIRVFIYHVFRVSS